MGRNVIYRVVQNKKDLEVKSRGKRLRVQARLREKKKKKIKAQDGNRTPDDAMQSSPT